jgi:ferrous iron transport protein B
MAEKRPLRVALAGNPNSGKTSVFNCLTGARQHVGNWPGVTVERKTGRLSHRGYDIEVVDLPGTYSLTTFSVEERVARSFIVDERPDVVVDVVDSGNLARNLYLTVQLLELGAHVVVDLNMWDELEASGAKLDRAKLAELLGAPVVPTVAQRCEGIEELLDAVVDLAEDRVPRHRHVPVSYGGHVDDVVAGLAAAIEDAAGAPGAAAAVPEGKAAGSGRPDALRRLPPRWVATKLIEGDPEVAALVEGAAPGLAAVRDAAARGARHIAAATGSDPERVISEGRHGFVAGALREALTETTVDRMELSRRIDGIFTNRFLGYPIFLFFMWLLFQATFRLGAYPMHWIDTLINWLCGTVCGRLPDSVVTDLFVDGIVGGVGSVIVFLPNILILFLGISFLEDSGYMARAAFLMDRIMHALGLHGKSFIPMLMGFGCSVPAIMATRTLESRRDRVLTVLLIPFMSCSAKFPVYLLIGGAFFGERAGSVVFVVYLAGVVAAILLGRLLARTLFRSAPEPFVMELPPYRLPTPKGLGIHMWERARLYLQKMGGVILVASVVLWFLGAFPRDEAARVSVEAEASSLRAAGTVEALARADRLEEGLDSTQIASSFIGRIGRTIAPAMAPLGFTWEMSVSLVTGFVAKEVIVSTLGVLYHAEAGPGEPRESLGKALRSPGSGITPLAAFAFMVFVLLYTPCVATVAAIRREAGAGWMWFSVASQLSLAWLVAFGVYQIGRLAGL